MSTVHFSQKEFHITFHTSDVKSDMKFFLIEVDSGHSPRKKILDPRLIKFIIVRGFKFIIFLYYFRWRVPDWPELILVNQTKLTFCGIGAQEVLRKKASALLNYRQWRKICETVCSQPLHLSDCFGDKRFGLAQIPKMQIWTLW